MKLHDTSAPLVHKVKNKHASDGRFLFFFSDPPHLIKTAGLQAVEHSGYNTALLYMLYNSLSCNYHAEGRKLYTMETLSGFVQSRQREGNRSMYCPQT